MEKEVSGSRVRKTTVSNGDYGELEIYDFSEGEESTKEEKSSKSEDIQEDVEERENPSDLKSLFTNVLRYFVFIAVSLVYWELIMKTQLGKFTASGLIFVFFIPAQALFLTTFAGIGNRLSSKITLPVILAIPAFYYMAQMIYLRNFGSLFSVSMAGMGNDAVDNFGWAVTDSIVGAIWLLILILLPVILAIALPLIGIPKISSYSFLGHIIVISLAVVAWFSAVLFIRIFGNDRLSPYYLLTSSSAVTDTSAKKLGTLTTGIVEAGAYYFGIGNDGSAEFALEEDEELDDIEDISSVVVETDIDSEEVVEEIVKTPWMNEAIDFNKIASDATDSNLKSLASYYATRKASTTNEYTGMFEGYNLIYICAESFWNYACNEEVTPTLYKMAHNGIVLNNYYNSFYNTTTNGEFAFCTSLWPDVSRNSKNGTDIGSFAQSSTKFMPQGLGDLFTAAGIPSYGFHNYFGKYYRRSLSWPNLGYNCRFTGDRGMYFSSNWPASDYELMQQTVDDYINDDVFHAYYMTFSGHGPYTSKNVMYNKNIGAVTSITGEEKYNDMARGYLAGELELELAMEYLLKRLEEAGKLDNTVIVLTGDHYPYYLEKEARDSLVGYEMDEDFEIYHSTCMIYNAGMSEPINVDNYCCNIDIAPTICNLFNIPFDSRLMMGRDIFSSEAHNRATLYNMSFVDDYVKYNYETGEATWTAKGNTLDVEKKQKHIDNTLKSIENEYMAACRTIEENFYLNVYEMSGLLTADEVAKEKARAEEAQNMDETFNAEDEAEKAQKEAEKILQQQIEQGLIMIDATVVTDPNLVDPNAVAVPAADPNAVVVNDAAPVVDANLAPVVDPNAAAVPGQVVVQ